MLKIPISFLIILILGLGLLFSLYINIKEGGILPNSLKETMVEEIKEVKEEISIITVYDNYQVNPRLKTGWGFSCIIKIADKNILFDTGGDSPTLLSNMEKMEIDLKKVDTIVLSHIHGDHIGGLEGFLKENANLTVYIPASFLSSVKKEIESSGAKYEDVKGPKKISEGVFSTGELGTWIKEQSLIINTEKGLIIITGCAHPGIIEIIKVVRELFSDKSIYLVLGGFHLTGASDSELKSIINDFRELGVHKAAPCHCSGDRCRELFKEEYKDNFIENGVGKIIKI